MLARPHVITAALALAACGDRRPPDDTLVMVIDAPMVTSDARYAISNNDTKLGRLVASGLTAVDTATMEPRLDLAERYDRLDDLTYDFTLRAGITFADGTPVTAADVAWTFTSVIAKDSDAVAHKQLAERFTSVEALDARRVRFHLTAPLATLFSDLDFGVLERAKAGPDGKFAGGIVAGAGPYILTSLGPTGATLVANPRAAGAVPKVPKVELRVVKDSSARVLMLLGGSADLCQNCVRLDLLGDLAAQDAVHVERGPSALLTYLMMNTEDPQLKDPRVRQAIALALDREAIIHAKLSDRAVVATGLLPPDLWAYRGDVARWPHDPARARALLDEAGVRDPDGAGPEPRLRLTYKTSSDAFRLAIARVIAAQLADVGIEVEVRAFEFATFFADVKKGQFQLASMQTSDITEPDYLYTYFHSDRIPGPKNPDGGNRWRYRNARVDALTTLGRRQLDRAARLATYGEVQEILARDLPIIPLWHEDNVAITNAAVHGYTILPNARWAGLVTTAKSPAQ
ncbi:MAG: ABC transporter substrate-binding protein [Deltaproteobacteria bacterium]|nr:ABC transporter substrate-binding protein [Deltaproteobacteria bacterium]